MAAAMRSGWIVAFIGTLAGCGGGDDATPGPGPSRPGGSANTYTPGVYRPSSNLAKLCVSPRPRTDDRQGTALDEKLFLRSWTDELYLWYSEVTDRDPAGYSVSDYFNLLRTTALTPSGQPKDKFHFTYDTAAWEALSQSGVQAGYGAQWIIFGTPPSREVLVAYTEPGSPATAAGIARGVSVLTADGVNIATASTQSQIDTLNAAFFPESSGQSHTFTIVQGGATRTLTMTSANVTSTPVQNVTAIPTANGLVGYLLFNDHIATSEHALATAINTLRGQNVVDLILDIRYNGGGYLAIASELAFMIAGASATDGLTFEKLVFNDKHPTINPVTGQALQPTPFYTQTQIGDPSHSPGQSLPSLNLPRVYVITTDGTCSASESIVNGLRGIGIDVYQIGTTTCGKPYGFYARDNCGTTYFSIQFKGVNADDFGDYADGFSPNNASNRAADELPGCWVEDEDFDRALGDSAERMLRAALEFRMSGNLVCPAVTSFGPGPSFKPELARYTTAGELPKTPWLENRILTE